LLRSRRVRFAWGALLSIALLPSPIQQPPGDARTAKALHRPTAPVKYVHGGSLFCALVAVSFFSSLRTIHRLL
jgi:hypothetical protein